jgi:LacI family transcriptional regulator
LTLEQIAKNVGLCKATVSFVLSGKAKQHHISPETIRAVEDYCRSVNYRPNIHAVRMSSKIVGNVMFLLNTGDRYSQTNSFSDYNVAQIIGGITHEARKAGCSLSVRVLEPGMDTDVIFDSFRSREIDGMIYYGTILPNKWIRVFNQEQCKVIGIGISPQQGISTININNREIATTLVDTLIKDGRSRFLYFAGSKDSYPGVERYAGFRDALAAHQIPWSEENCFNGNFDEQTASRIIEEYIARKQPLPDAVICANDSMAIGIIRSLKKYGISIPKQVAVTGGDNIMVSDYVSPSLTTFDNLAEAMGAEAFRLLSSQINGKSDIQDLILQSKIVRRESA